MASRTTCRSLQRAIKRIRPSCECANSSARTSTVAPRSFSTTPPRSVVELEKDREERPRWSYTPEEMKAPYPYKVKDGRKPWECNSDPERLDRFYANFLGPGGENVLTEELKWLAITHKSFDQGRRGFNDRLAFFGRRLLTLQANLGLVNSTTFKRLVNEGKPQHPALEGLANLEEYPVSRVLTKIKLAALADTIGMREILRWQPKDPKQLLMSGDRVVMATSLYAILGAIGLHRGGAFANEVAREKILKPLGIR
ncbi:hypothetical protein HYALB_00004829 [Hymenoscyphus albidus]|uniref:RNase III domain-containing protein n=1 Tax=Hymenoscyphus albidus TaxID=595503 RepID=A0A9N9M2P7_9HELO|nr:hypothetical protein HYALB_00004829 [Hymenoscyphus albidus]